jgi:hypothetical protein
MKLLPHLEQFRWSSGLFVLANLLGLWACATRYLHGSEIASILATAPVRIAPPTPLSDPPSETLDFASIQTAALFYESRGFYTPPVLPPVKPPPSFRLSGTLVIPQQPTVAMLVQSSSGVRLKVRAGDDVEGWTVESIQPQVVIVRYAEQRFEIRSAARAQAFGMQRMPLSSAAPVARPQGSGIRVLGRPH